jgi:hypothetical protein
VCDANVRTTREPFKEEIAMAERASAQAAPLWTWSAVLAGVVTSLTIQALLTMLALGVGLFAIDIPTAQSAPLTVSTAALLYWIAAGIFSAFAGGAVAGAYAPATNDQARSMHGLAAWAVATLIVLGVAALSAGGSTAVAANMSGPAARVASQITAPAARPAQGALTAQQVEQMRKAFATAMLASLVGLLAGAVAAGAGGYFGRDIADEFGVPVGQRARA